MLKVESIKSLSRATWYLTTCTMIDTNVQKHVWNLSRQWQGGKGGLEHFLDI